MPPRQTARDQLAPDLEALADAADRRLRAEVNDDVQAVADAQADLLNAAAAAMAGGHSLSAIAAAEQRGKDRARAELGKDLLRAIERAARRRREVELEFEQAILRADKLGLLHRDIGAAGKLAHTTVRAIVSRASEHAAPLPQADASMADGSDPHTRSQDGSLDHPGDDAQLASAGAHHEQHG